MIGTSVSVRGVGSLRTRVSIKSWLCERFKYFRMICESAGCAFCARCHARVSLPSITFNLFAQTSQLAARINLGSPLGVGNQDEGSRKKTKRGDRGKERQRDQHFALRGPGRKRPEEPRVGNNRPITWVTEADRSREPVTSVYTGPANATRAAKPIHKAGSSAYVNVSSSFVLLAVLSVAAVAVSTTARSDASTRCYSRSRSFVLVASRASIRRPLSVYVHLPPGSGGREIIQSFCSSCASPSLASINVPPATTMRGFTFSVRIVSLFCFASYPCLMPRSPGWIDRWSELSR